MVNPSGPGLFVKEAAQKSLFSLCVKGATRHQGECSFDIRELIWCRIRNIFIVCCSYEKGENRYSSAEGHAKQENKMCFVLVIVMSIFYLSIY